MKPAWDKLSRAYEGSRTVVVGAMDCTTPDGFDFCAQRGVTGYPNLMWGATADLIKYEGGRTFDELQAFALTHLPDTPCSPKNMGTCNEETRRMLSEFLAMDFFELTNVAATMTRRQEAHVREFERQRHLHSVEVTTIMDEMRAETEREKMQKEREERRAERIAQGKGRGGKGRNDLEDEPRYDMEAARNRLTQRQERFASIMAQHEAVLQEIKDSGHELMLEVHKHRREEMRNAKNDEL
mmetsp:Transcript_103174/g.291334  ORF Transcript_103174/g.291334 Transcript_103174/m.291334 type:complete len:240 (-) Transcript_103174:297-1016(-)